jgi:hypothetical protein
MPTTTEQPRKPSRALVDSTLALDELLERFGMGLVRQRVPQHARPFGPGALVNLGRVAGAANYRGQRLIVIG